MKKEDKKLIVAIVSIILIFSVAGFIMLTLVSDFYAWKLFSSDVFTVTGTVSAFNESKLVIFTGNGTEMLFATPYNYCYERVTGTLDYLPKFSIGQQITVEYTRVAELGKLDNILGYMLENATVGA